MHKKKLKIVFGLFLIVLIAVFYYPVEYCVSLNDNISDEKYIIVKYVEATDSFWIIVGNENGFFDKKNNIKFIKPDELVELTEEDIKPIHLRGNKPTRKYGDYIAHSCYFICFVDYVGKTSFNIEGTGEYDLYDVKDCKMLAPLKRGKGNYDLKISDFFIMPQNYITIIDLIEADYNNAEVEDNLIND